MTTTSSVTWGIDDDDAKLDSYIIESSKSGKSIRKMAEEIGVSHNSIRHRIKARKLDVNVKKKVNNWREIAQRIRDIDLPFYQGERIYPLELRQMYYRLVTLKVMIKSKNNYMMLSHVTSEARRGRTSDFSKPSRYGRLPIDCFIDKHSPILMGETDIYKSPHNPTPAEPPADWEDYIENEILTVKHAYNKLKNYSIIDKYDGTCTPGGEGENPGLWYMQPKYVEIWVESGNLQKTINILRGDNKVHVAAFGGIGSTTRLYDNCMRLKRIKDNNQHIEKIVILYCGDFDSTGDWLDQYIINAIEFYTKLKHGEDFELKRVAVLPEQIEEYDLIEDPEYDPAEKNKDPRFERFKKKYPELIEKYGEKFGVQLEAMLTTTDRINEFKDILDDAIKAEWDEDVYLENCPEEEYNYEENEEEEPHDIEIDNDYPENPREGEEDMTIREAMQYRIDQALLKLGEKEN